MKEMRENITNILEMKNRHNYKKKFKNHKRIVWTSLSQKIWKVDNFLEKYNLLKLTKEKYTLEYRPITI